MMDEKSWKLNFRMLWSGHFLSVVSLTMIVPLLPFYMKDLGVSEISDNLFWSGLALSAPAISYMIAAPLWGRLGDRWGRKRMVVRALIGLSGALILMGFVQTPLQLLIVRLFQGAFGGVVDAGAAFVGSQAPEAVRGKVFGKLEGAVAAGSLAGPLIGGLLVGRLGFQAVLFTMGGLLILLSLLIMAFLHEDRGERVKQATGYSGSNMLQSLKGLFVDRKVRSFLFVGMCANVGVYGLVIVFAQFLEGVVVPGNAAAWVGVSQALTWGAGWLSSSWWGKRNDGYPVEKNFFWASLGCGVSIMLQPLCNQIEWILVLRLVQGFCFSALIQSIFLVVSRASLEENRGFRMGLTSSVLVIGQISGGMSAAWLGRFVNLEMAIASFGFVFIIAAMVIRSHKDIPPISVRRPVNGKIVKE